MTEGMVLYANGKSARVAMWFNDRGVYTLQFVAGKMPQPVDDSVRRYGWREVARIALTTIGRERWMRDMTLADAVDQLNRWKKQSVKLGMVRYGEPEGLSLK